MEHSQHGFTTVDDNDVMNHRRIQLPLSVVLATLLYCAEFIIAAFVCNIYSERNHTIWMGMTIAFMVIPTAITQMALIVIHRDLGRHDQMILFLHLLLGPVIRCIEALFIYFKADRKEEPYVTLSKKFNLEKGKEGQEMEWVIGQSGRMLTAHRHAFKLIAVIQAFLGSTPQLALQMYATIQENHILGVRLALMIVALISITYGALVCSVLDIQLRYSDYKVRFCLAAYFCMALWRGLEAATRVTSLVLFSIALTYWVIPVGLINVLFFFFLPWFVFWKRKGLLPENNVSKLYTITVQCLLTLLYACINVFCWSAVQLDLSHEEFVDKKEHWGLLTAYYYGRLAENILLNTLWYFNKSDDMYEYIYAPLLGAQFVCYILAVLFMLLFYQFCHPCRRMFKRNVYNHLLCVCCPKGEKWESIYITSTDSTSSSGTVSTTDAMVQVPEDAVVLRDPQNTQHTDISQLGDTDSQNTQHTDISQLGDRDPQNTQHTVISQLGDQETAIVEDIPVQTLQGHRGRFGTQ